MTSSAVGDSTLLAKGPAKHHPLCMSHQLVRNFLGSEAKGNPNLVCIPLAEFYIPLAEPMTNGCLWVTHQDLLAETGFAKQLVELLLCLHLPAQAIPSPGNALPRNRTGESAQERLEGSLIYALYCLTNRDDWLAAVGPPWQTGSSEAQADPGRLAAVLAGAAERSFRISYTWDPLWCATSALT